MRCGYLCILHADGSITERDVAVCTHCQRVIELKPGTMGQVQLVVDPRQPSGYREESACFCGKCYGPICLTCEAARTCRPHQQRLEQQEAAARLSQAMGWA